MLVAGTARVDVTPTDLGRTFLAGFGLNRRAQGVLDRLEAVALYLADGERSLALVAVDCIGLTRPFVEQVRGRLVCFADAGAVILCATHTHSGPDTLGMWGTGPFGALPTTSGLDPLYMDELAQKLAAAISQARAQARTATLRSATFETPAQWSKNERPGGARFDQATAFALDDARGERIATVLNWASHPETLWEDNPWLSPDYPGHFRAAVRAQIGGEALFFSGPLGAMLTPNLARPVPFADRVAHIEKLGADLAHLTLTQLAAVDAVPVERLTHHWRTVELENRNWLFALLRRLGVVSLDWVQGRVRCEVHLLGLGPLQVLTVPGEPSPEVGRQLLACLPGEAKALFALAVDEIGYVLQPGQFADAQYKYERSMSLGVNTAARLEAAAMTLVKGGAR